MVDVISAKNQSCMIFFDKYLNQRPRSCQAACPLFPASSRYYNINLLGEASKNQDNYKVDGPHRLHVSVGLYLGGCNSSFNLGPRSNLTIPATAIIPGAYMSLT